MRTMEEEEKLLPGETRDREQVQSSSVRHRFFCTVLGLYFVALHVALAFSLFGHVSVSNAPVTRLQTLRSQIRSVTSDVHATNFTSHTAYSGPPNKENSAAWKNMLKNLYFNATKEEVVTEGGNANTNIQVKGGGYLAALGAHHELHCLNKIRYFLYSHETQQTWIQGDMEYWYRHIDHCVEVLRLSVMCAGDLSLYTFTWPTNNNSAFLDLHSKSKRTCADWSQIEEWSRDKRTSMQKGLLVPEEAFEN